MKKVFLMVGEGDFQAFGLAGKLFGHLNPVTCPLVTRYPILP